MKRRLLNLLTLVSLLLCVAVGVLWVRSYWRDAELHWEVADQAGGLTTVRRWSLDSEGGRIVFQWGAKRYASGRRPHRPPLRIGSGPALPPQARTPDYVWQSLWDFHAQTVRGVPASGWRNVITYVLVPHWLPVVPLAALPAWWLVRWRRGRRRRARRACPACGYDLRATPGRCPECGRHFPPPDPNVPTATA